MQHVDRATYDKIQRHLTDINDRITDEDIRNVRIGVYAGPIAYTAAGKTGLTEKEEKGK